MSKTKNFRRLWAMALAIALAVVMLPVTAFAGVPEIILSQTSLFEFTAVSQGYSPVTAETITITNTGGLPTGDLTIELTGANSGDFALSTTSIATLTTMGDTNTFTVKPNDDLTADTYLATVTVSGDNSISESFDISFTVYDASQKDVISVVGLTNAQIGADTITSTVIGTPYRFNIDFTVSEGARWELYDNFECIGNVLNPDLALDMGENIFYVKVIAADDGEKVYTITITLNALVPTPTPPTTPSRSSDDDDSSSSGSGSGGPAVDVSAWIRSAASALTGSSSNVGLGGVVSSTVIQSQATAAISAATGTSAVIRTQNASSITAADLKTLADAATQAGKGLTLHADTLRNGAVQGRLYVNPMAFSGAPMPPTGLQLGVFTEPAQTNAISSLFGAHFSNTVSVVRLDQQDSFGARLQIAAQVDLEGLNTESLRFYSYNAATNTYTQIANPAYSVDANGYLHFYTQQAGSIIITDQALTAK